MSASLVGSEMCIRDRAPALRPFPRTLAARWPGGRRSACLWRCRQSRPVSYTHLTLPTICSV
eukprot:6769095-Alexandrium_andersonii.AAC.1